MVREKTEATLRERFGYDAWALIYDVDTVRTLQNPASVNAVATSAILRLTPPTLTPRRNAANLAIPDCTRPPENDATAT